MGFWQKMWRALFFDDSIRTYKPTTIVDHSPWKKPYYEEQLDFLKEVLSQQLCLEVHYSFESNAKVVLIFAGGEIVARLTLHMKGALRKNTYILIRTNLPDGYNVWFQLAFLSLIVKVTPLKEQLLLT